MKKITAKCNSFGRQRELLMASGHVCTISLSLHLCLYLSPSLNLHDYLPSCPSAKFGNSHSLSLAWHSQTCAEKVIYIAIYVDLDVSLIGEHFYLAGKKSFAA